MPNTVEVREAVAALSDGSELAVPYWRVDSGKSGQVFLVIAEQHGNEVQGCEVLRRFRTICAETLRAGVVYLVPFANPLALRQRRSHLSLGPEQAYGDDQGHNMNRTWPGHPVGNDTQRISYALYQAVVRHCTRCLDLHSWSRFTATCALVRGDVALSRQLAAASGIHFQMRVTPPPPQATGGVPIGRLFNDHGLGSLTIELASQWVISEPEVALGLRAAVNLARLLGLLAGEPELPDTPPVCFAQDDLPRLLQRVTAPVSGLFIENGLTTSAWVEAGQPLGHLLADDLQTIPLLAPASGFLWQYGCHREHCDVGLPPQHPYAGAGDLLAAILSR